MKLTTANSKSPDYTEKHEIYVGTHTGTFKKLDVASENPHLSTNLQNIQNLTKDSRVTALNYGNEEQSEILIGRANKFVKVYDVKTNNYISNVELLESPIVGLGRYEGKLIAGFGTGKIQIMDDPKPIVLNAGDDMSRMRQCPFDLKLVAAGGKDRKNNLKIFDLTSMSQVFSSKNVPNDFLNLEVPIWDCDVAFLDSNRIGTCSRHGYIRVYDIRTQRRPISCYTNEDQFRFSCLISRDPYLYAGTTMGALKAFDTRNLKNFVHTYKGFTGSLSDLTLDGSGKFLFSASLDRYVRVHHVDTCVMLYQCYVKSKATRILVRNSDQSDLNQTPDSDSVVLCNEENNEQSDDEYNAIFEKMPIISDNVNDNENDKQKLVLNKKRRGRGQSENLKKTKKS